LPGKKHLRNIFNSLMKPSAEVPLKYIEEIAKLYDCNVKITSDDYIIITYPACPELNPIVLSTNRAKTNKKVKEVYVRKFRNLINLGDTFEDVLKERKNEEN